MKSRVLKRLFFIGVAYTSICLNIETDRLRFFPQFQRLKHLLLFIRINLVIISNFAIKGRLSAEVIAVTVRGRSKIS